MHEGQGGTLYTWGGVNESVAFGSSEKHDSNKVGRLSGVLGHALPSGAYAEQCALSDHSLLTT